MANEVLLKDVETWVRAYKDTGGGNDESVYPAGHAQAGEPKVPARANLTASGYGWSKVIKKQGGTTLPREATEITRQYEGDDDATVITTGATKTMSFTVDQDLTNALHNDLDAVKGGTTIAGHNITHMDDQGRSVVACYFNKDGSSGNFQVATFIADWGMSTQNLVGGEMLTLDCTATLKHVSRTNTGT